MSLYNFNKRAFLGLRGETKSPKILNTRFLFLSTLYTRQINFILSLLSLCKPLPLRSTFTSFYVQTLIKHNTFEIVMVLWLLRLEHRRLHTYQIISLILVIEEWHISPLVHKIRYQLLRLTVPPLPHPNTFTKTPQVYKPKVWLH